MQARFRRCQSLEATVQRKLLSHAIEQRNNNLFMKPLFVAKIIVDRGQVCAGEFAYFSHRCFLEAFRREKLSSRLDQAFASGMLNSLVCHNGPRLPYKCFIQLF